jgi:hypothetical protein
MRKILRMKYFLNICNNKCMRDDMRFVVVERPRQGHKNKICLRNRGKQIPLEELPKFEPIGQLYCSRYKTKSLSDLIGPLRRFLFSKIGQRWNDVKSEMSAVLKKDSVMKIHVWSHIDSHVEENSEEINGIRVKKSRWFSKGVPLDRQELSNESLYVDDDGILRLYKSKRKPEPPKKKDRIVLDKVVLQEIDGVWYKADLEWSTSKNSCFWELVIPSYIPFYERHKAKPRLEAITYGEKTEKTTEVKTKKEFFAELEDRLRKAEQKQSEVALRMLVMEEEYFKKFPIRITRKETKYYLIGKNKKQLSKKELNKFGLKNAK